MKYDLSSLLSGVFSYNWSQIRRFHHVSLRLFLGPIPTLCMEKVSKMVIVQHFSRRHNEPKMICGFFSPSSYLESHCRRQQRRVKFEKTISPRGLVKLLLSIPQKLACRQQCFFSLMKSKVSTYDVLDTLVYHFYYWKEKLESKE